jgi:hypothetical protein
MREQHFGELEKVSGFRRTTRYESFPFPAKADSETMYLAVHEWSSAAVPMVDIWETVNTEWSEKVLQSTKVVHGEMWELIKEYGETSTPL